MDIQRIETLIAKKKLTDAEKKEIREAADVAGIQYTMRQGCRDCWEKILLKLYEAKDVVANASRDGWKLKDPKHSFMCMGVRYDNESIKEMKIGKIHPNVREMYFVKDEQPKQDDEPNSDIQRDEE